jgi:hypothetical protein
MSPAALPKNDYVPQSDSDAESECENNSGAVPAAKVFQRGQLHIHKSYTGLDSPRELEPVGYVNTCLY